MVKYMKCEKCDVLRKKVKELQKKVDDNKALRPVYMARMDAESRLNETLERIIVKIARAETTVHIGDVDE